MGLTFNDDDRELMYVAVDPPLGQPRLLIHADGPVGRLLAIDWVDAVTIHKTDGGQHTYRPVSEEGT